jgi:hypothetical protein
MVYIAHFYDNQQWLGKAANERLALILLAVPVINFTLQTFLLKCNFSIFMAILSIAFFCREWHFPGTGTGIYVALALLAIWGVKQKDKFFEIIGNHKFRIWLFATFATYLLSQLIARRVFRYVHLPNEDELHIYFEETVETAAHIMLGVASFAAWKLRGNKTANHNSTISKIVQTIFP